jgi:hypothetical protein
MLGTKECSLKSGESPLSAATRRLQWFDFEQFTSAAQTGFVSKNKIYGVNFGENVQISWIINGVTAHPARIHCGAG